MWQIFTYLPTYLFWLPLIPPGLRLLVFLFRFLFMLFLWILSATAQHSISGEFFRVLVQCPFKNVLFTQSGCWSIPWTPWYKMHVILLQVNIMKVKAWFPHDHNRWQRIAKSGLGQGWCHGVDWGGHVHPTFLRSVFIPKQKRYKKH